MIALDSDIPVGWCRLGPVSSFERLGRSRKLRREDMADWAIVCIFIARSHRGRHIAPLLVRQAAQLAFGAGARSVEGYPSVSHRARMPAAFAWTGVPAIFEMAGFRRLSDDAGARLIYRADRPSLPRSIE